MEYDSNDSNEEQILKHTVVGGRWSVVSGKLNALSNILNNYKLINNMLEELLSITDTPELRDAHRLINDTYDKIIDRYIVDIYKESR